MPSANGWAGPSGPPLFLFPTLPSFLLPVAAVHTEPSSPPSISCPASISFFTDKTEAIFNVPPLLPNVSASAHLAVFLHSGFLPGPPPSDGPHCLAPWSLAGPAVPLFCSLLFRPFSFSPLAPPRSLLLPAAYNPDQFSFLKQTSDLLRLLPVFLPQKSSSSHSSLNTLLALPHLPSSFSPAPSLLVPSSSPFSCRLPGHFFLLPPAYYFLSF